MARIVDVLERREPVHSAPSTIKAASLLLQLICEKDANGDGMTLDQLIISATERGARRALPDAVDAEIVEVGEAHPAAVPVPTVPAAPRPTREEVRTSRYQQTTEAQERASAARATLADPAEVKAAIREVLRPADSDPAELEATRPRKVDTRDWEFDP